MTDAVKHRPIKRQQRLYQDIMDRFEQLIVHGHLQPGDRLPAEAELADQLAVSRTAVREALTALQEKGLVRIEVGRGTFVSTPSADKVSEHFSLLFRLEKVSLEDLIEVRTQLEVGVAGLAATNRTEENLERLRANLREMEKSTDLARSFREAGADFHEELARATGNSMYAILLQPVAALMGEIRKDFAYVPGSLEESLNHHRQILRCVEDQDAVGARELMRKHLLHMQHAFVVRKSIDRTTEAEAR